MTTTGHEVAFTPVLVISLASHTAKTLHSRCARRKICQDKQKKSDEKNFADSAGAPPATTYPRRQETCSLATISGDMPIVGTSVSTPTSTLHIRKAFHSHT
ncbi:hypothetical protein F9C07_2107085 [Aspergillus flavus]|uniref:Uncharacterized protein n=1 Tax=Aspergillus flavus (strain ATCC 200026 / FGSC A1120 / IAM 13836 / NRRL 3357 / JCM 12722 / SRRC 167) TaxID=332952 RepID=A0A7U2MVS2_ASPFN|nr:hypothetical protein F9C07_2107085 [Aspergillus flavus]